MASLEPCVYLNKRERSIFVIIHAIVHIYKHFLLTSHYLFDKGPGLIKHPVQASAPLKAFVFELAPQDAQYVIHGM